MKAFLIHKSFLNFLLAVFLLASSGQAAQNQTPPPVVVVSLKPLHSWVCSLMKGRATPTLLLKGKLSPHTAVLRPRDIERVKSADILVWIGPSFEAPFKKLMESLPAEKKITLEDFPDLNWLPQRRGEIWDMPHEHAHGEHGHPHGHDHDHGASFQDGHIWMDPVRAEKIVTLLAKKLSEKDPLYQDLYEKNLKHLKVKLRGLHQALQQRFREVREKPFFVMHDAYQYLEKRYNLLAQGVVLLSPEHPPSGKHLQALQKRLQQQKKACVFIEPQLQYSSVIPFLKSLGVKEGSLDPLGVDIPEGPDFYDLLMNKLATDFEACFHQ